MWPKDRWIAVVLGVQCFWTTGHRLNHRTISSYPRWKRYQLVTYRCRGRLQLRNQNRRNAVVLGVRFLLQKWIGVRQQQLCPHPGGLLNHMGFDSRRTLAHMRDLASWLALLLGTRNVRPTWRRINKHSLIADQGEFKFHMVRCRRQRQSHMRSQIEWNYVVLGI